MFVSISIRVIRAACQVVQGLLKGVHKVAVKMLHNINSSELMANVMREAAIIDACRHPHVVQVSPSSGY